MTTLPRRILVIEDDASMQRLLRLAIEDEPVALYLCSNVPDAVSELATSSFDLIVTDLMLPGESGIDLIKRLSVQPALRGQAELIVLSAGIDPQQTFELQKLGVDGFLLKPVSMARLRQLLLHGLSGSIDAGQMKLDPVNAYFEGNQALFEQFAAHCAIQFDVDCRQGDTAEQSHDFSGLHNIAHTLSSALEMLGEKEMVLKCKTLMHLTKEPSHPAHIQQAWHDLRDALKSLHQRLRLKSLQ